MSNPRLLGSVKVVKSKKNEYRVGSVYEKLVEYDFLPVAELFFDKVEQLFVV